MSQPIVIMTPEQLEAFSKKLLDDYIAKVPPPTNAAIELIGPDELCKRLGISIPTQITYRKKRKIPYMEIGNQIRYNWVEVVEALKNKI